MHSLRSKTFLSALGCAAVVVAHGHVANFIINGVQWPGFDPTKDPYMKTPPTVAGWATEARDNGFVDKSTLASADIICHKQSKNAKASAEVAAGDNVFIPWDTWPESHHGPVINYLANCGQAGCEAVDKSTLKFFKIDEVGLVDASSSPGVWGSDQLIKNKNGWMVQIPKSIASGNYVLRHEIIALHSTGDPQMYPQCINLKVTGGGTDNPEGVLGTQLYQANDPGLTFNIYNKGGVYKIPGPALYSGAASLAQATSAATTTTSFGGASSPTSKSPSSPPSASSPTAPSSPSASSSASSTSKASSPTGQPQASDKPKCPGALRQRRHPRDVQPRETNLP